MPIAEDLPASAPTSSLCIMQNSEITVDVPLSKFNENIVEKLLCDHDQYIEKGIRVLKKAY